MHGSFDRCPWPGEAPQLADAHSGHMVVGCYILTPVVFSRLETTPLGAGSEIRLTDACQKLLVAEMVLDFRLEGKRFYCSKFDYQQENVQVTSKHSSAHLWYQCCLRQAMSTSISSGGI